MDENSDAEDDAIVERAPERMLTTVSTFLTIVRNQSLSTALTDLQRQARDREGAAAHALSAGVAYRIVRRVAELNEPPTVEVALSWLSEADPQQYELATRHALLLAESVSERVRSAR